MHSVHAEKSFLIRVKSIDKWYIETFIVFTQFYSPKYKYRTFTDQMIFIICNI